MRRYDLATKYALIGLLVFIVSSGLPTFAAEPMLWKSDKTPVTAIEFSLDDNNLEQFGVKLSRQKIVEQVSKNLSEWQYPVKLANSDYSHILKARLDKIAHQSTPVGFSFSSGNSEPRSAEFQKADVLPVSCRFSKTGQANGGVEQTMTFSASQLLGGPSQDRLLAILTDHITTACFNLLSDLQLQPVNNKPVSTEFKPTWMPDIRVEVKEVKPLETPVETKSTKKLDQTVNSEGRKQIIIHNQGTPLIINFGHERR